MVVNHFPIAPDPLKQVGGVYLGALHPGHFDGEQILLTTHPGKVFLNHDVRVGHLDFHVLIVVKNILPALHDLIVTFEDRPAGMNTAGMDIVLPHTSHHAQILLVEGIVEILVRGQNLLIGVHSGVIPI